LPVETVRRFTNYIETSKSIFFIKRFSQSLKEQEKAPRKVYAIDVGLSNSIAFRFIESLGKIAENVIAIELKRREAFNPNLEIYYWKDYDEKEVDFIVKEGLKIKQLIQCSWDITNPKAKKREVASLIRGSKKLDCNNLLILNESFEGKEKINEKEIVYKPIWKWLLEE
jgi:predicted AAA+ superfamily ATPase